MAAPTVTTSDAIRIAKTRASGVGNITATGAEAITAHGHCWALTADPDTGDSKTDYGARTSAETGAFTSNITGLSANTEYHTRAYATNGSGTSYGADKTFTTKAAGYEYPAGVLTRVSGLVHRYRPGSYTLEMTLGGVSSDFGMPVWSDAEPALPTAVTPPVVVPPVPPPTSSPPPPSPPMPGRVPPRPGIIPSPGDVTASTPVSPYKYIPGAEMPTPIYKPPVKEPSWWEEFIGWPHRGIPEEAFRPTARVTEVRPFPGEVDWMKKYDIPPLPGKGKGIITEAEIRRRAIAEREARAEQARRRAKTRAETGKSKESRAAARRREEESKSGRWRYT